MCILARHRLLKKYSYSDIVAPLINDLKKFQVDGLQLTVGGQDVKVYGGLATVSTDNLSAHAFGGFVANFNSGRVCRFCMAVYEDISSKFFHCDFVERNATSHAYHLNAIQKNPLLGKNTYGVTNKCAFSELDYFDVTQSLPPDLMHDFLEGVVQKTLTFVIRDLHRGKHCTVQHLNEELKQFRIGENDKSSKPVRVPEKILQDGVSLPGKAIEKWCLFRILPNLIGHYVPEDYPPWKLYLLCREIADIIFSPTVQVPRIHFLGTLIGDFLELFQELYPEKITPKFHYLVHYPTLLLKFGPLRAFSCMRFEGKHQYFQRVASVNCNFKNICQSLAKRHQLRQCWELSSGDILKQGCEPAGGRSVPFKSLPPLTHELIALKTGCIPTDKEQIWKAETLTVDTVCYKKNDFFITDTVHKEQIPLFHKVFHIIQFRSSWLICAKLFMPTRFVNHIHAYEVEDTGQWIVLRPGEELDYHCHALDGYTHDDFSGYLVSLIHLPSGGQYCNW